MDKIDKDEIEKFMPDESEKLEILTDLINRDYTVEEFRSDYEESLTNE